MKSLFRAAGAMSLGLALVAGPAHAKAPASPVQAKAPAGPALVAASIPPQAAPPAQGSQEIQTALFIGQGTGKWGAVPSVSASAPATSAVAANLQAAPTSAVALPLIGAASGPTSGSPFQPAAQPVAGTVSSQPALTVQPAKIYTTMAQAAAAGVNPFKKAPVAASAPKLQLVAHAPPPAAPVWVWKDPHSWVRWIRYEFDSPLRFAELLGNVSFVAWLLSQVRKIC